MTGADQYQVRGDHYQELDPQPWAVATAWSLTFLEGNVLKYLARWKRKQRHEGRGGDIDDLRKAKHYLEKLIEVELEREGE